MIAVKRLLSGPNADICVVLNSRGSSDVEDFIVNLDERQQSKLTQILIEFCERGEIKSEYKFKYLGDKLYEFKSKSVRILCCFLPDSQHRTQLLIHGFIKKSQRTPRKELNRARVYIEQLYNEGYSHVP